MFRTFSICGRSNGTYFIDALKILTTTTTTTPHAPAEERTNPLRGVDPFAVRSLGSGICNLLSVPAIARHLFVKEAVGSLTSTN